MKQQKEHIIKSQQYHIDLEDQVEAYQVQSNVSLLQASRINSLIEGVLDQFSDQENIYQFDKIELDLGIIKKSNYENELVYRLEEELKRYFAYNIQANGKLRVGKAVKVRNKKLEQLEHFFLRGYLKWDASFHREPSIILKDLFAENQTDTIKMIVKYGKNETVRRRMIFQFREEPLEQIVEAIVPNESSYMIAHKRSVLKHQEKHYFLKTGINTLRNAVWDILLTYLFTEAGSYHNKKNFLSYLIQKIAKRYNLTYQFLLKTILDGSESMKETDSHTEFRKLVKELEIEQESEEPVNPADSEETILEKIKQMDYYLKSGTFTSKFQPASKKVFNQQLERLVQTKNQVVVHYFEKWMVSTDARTRFLRIADDKILNEIVEWNSEAYVKEGCAFFEDLLKEEIGLSSKSRNFFKEIKAKKGRLILSSFKEGIGSSSIYSLDLLTKIYNEFKYKAVIFHEFLEEIQTNLSPEYKKAIALFFKKTVNKGRMGSLLRSKVMDKMVQEVQYFTNSNKLEYWEEWLDLHVVNWMEQTGLKKTDLLAHLKIKLLESSSTTLLLSFFDKIELKNVRGGVESFGNEKEQIEIVNTSKKERTHVFNKNRFNIVLLETLDKSISKIFSSYPLFSDRNAEVSQLFRQVCEKYHVSIEVVFKSMLEYLSNDPSKKQMIDQLTAFKLLDTAVVNPLINKDLEQNKQSWVHDVLEKGVLPWWADGYSLKLFNRDFTQLWNSSTVHRKELLSTIEKHCHDVPMTKLLNEINLRKVWGELNPSLNQSFTHEVSIFQQLLRQKLLPLGLITMSQYTHIREQLLQVLFKKQRSPGRLNDFAQGLRTVVADANSRCVNQVFVPMLKWLKNKTSDQSLETGLNDWLTKQLEDGEKQELDRLNHWTLSAFLSKYESSEQIESGESSALFFQLKKRVAIESKQFFEWLNQEQFRVSLLKELKEREVIELIQLHLNVHQKDFFDESMVVLNRIGTHISKQNFNQLKQSYYQLLLLKLGNGGFSSWGVKDWSVLFNQCMLNVLGKKLSSKILLEDNGKDEDREKKGNVEGIDVLHHIHLLNLKELATKEELYRKLGAEEKSREFLDALFIKNAGLIILSPYLGMLFDKCGLMEDGNFINAQSQFKAVHLLQYAATGQTEKEEHELVIHKLLCGVSITEPIERQIELESNEKETVDGLLKAITQQWTPLKGTSIDGLRSSFLQREGKIEEEEGQFFLKMEHKAFDMLLDQIPWNIGKIKLSWMKKILEVEWR